MKKIRTFICCLLFAPAVLAQSKGKGKGMRVVLKSVYPQADSIHIGGLPGDMRFVDHRPYLLIENDITGRKYIYWKKRASLQPVQIDSALIRRIYFDFLKNPEEYDRYMLMSRKSQFKPRIASLCAYDDSTVLGCLVTYNSELVVENGHTFRDFSQMLSIVEIRLGKPVKLFFVDDHIPLPFHSLNSGIQAYKHNVYLDVMPEADTLERLNRDMKLLVRMKRQQNTYVADQVLPDAINDYLIKNKVYYNYNIIHFDNGYSLMSLSNYITNLETGERISLPFADSLFRNIRIDPATNLINYYVSSFRYNKDEQRFYIRYNIDKHSFVASFRPHAQQFETNELLFEIHSDFSKALKNLVLSADGKRVVYCLTGSDWMYYVSVAELQRRAREYKTLHTSE